MLGDLGMLCKLHLYEHGLNRYKPCIYGDSSYPLKQLLMVQFTGAAITLLQDVWNKSMSQLRISVERVFGDIINQFSFWTVKGPYIKYIGGGGRGLLQGLRNILGKY